MYSTDMKPINSSNHLWSVPNVLYLIGAISISTFGDLYFMYRYFEMDWNEYDATKEVFGIFLGLKLFCNVLQCSTLMQSVYNKTSVLIRSTVASCLILLFLLTLMSLYYAADYLLNYSTYPLMVWRICESGFLIVIIERNIVLYIISLLFQKSTFVSHNNNTNDLILQWINPEIYIQLVEVVFGVIEMTMIGLYFYMGHKYFTLPWCKLYDLVWVVWKISRFLTWLPTGLSWTKVSDKDY